MRRPRLLALIVTLLVASAPAWAADSPSLGPVDGHDLTPTDLGRVEVAFHAPDFTLEDETGRAWKLSDLRGEKAAVLVFYRGHW